MKLQKHPLRVPGGKLDDGEHMCEVYQLFYNLFDAYLVQLTLTSPPPVAHVQPIDWTLLFRNLCSTTASDSQGELLFCASKLPALQVSPSMFNLCDSSHEECASASLLSGVSLLGLLS